jgi:hypothetical protein
MRHELRTVPCRFGCKRLLERRASWSVAACVKCLGRYHRRKKKETLSGLRHQARQLRLVFHVLGWEPEQFWEMLNEMRRSPMCFRSKPEGKPARRDWRMERKAS